MAQTKNLAKFAQTLPYKTLDYDDFDTYNGDAEHDMWVDFDYYMNTGEPDVFGDDDFEDEYEDDDDCDYD